ncbi:MAG: class I SAM-dependent methyltransferase [Ginsengibacter sp.]
MQDAISEILKIANEVHPANKLSDRESLVSQYYQYHPRLSSIKNCSPDAKVLDIGCGSGRLGYWKNYLLPKRNDIYITGIDLYTPVEKTALDAFFKVNLDEEILPFPDKSFDFIFMSHLIEHVQDWKALLFECDRVLKEASTLYIETPSLHSVNLPPRNLFVENGFTCTTINFYDDSTHTVAVDLDDVKKHMTDIGYYTLNQGYCKSVFLEDALIQYGFHFRDEEVTSYGIWSKLLFASGILLQKRSALLY